MQNRIDRIETGKAFLRVALFKKNKNPGCNPVWKFAISDPLS
jgi:hypothetical protein